MGIRALIVVLLVAVSGAYARELATHRSYAAALPTLAGLPTSVAGWYSEEIPMTKTVAAVLDADVAVQRVYRRADGAEVNLFVAYFAQQQVNSQIHSPRQCVPGMGYGIVSIEKQPLQCAGGVVAVTRMLIRRNEHMQEMVYWFRTRSGTVNGEYALKWDLVKNSLARRPTDAVFVRYLAPIENADDMRELMSQLDAPLNSILAEVGLR